MPLHLHMVVFWGDCQKMTRRQLVDLPSDDEFPTESIFEMSASEIVRTSQGAGKEGINGKWDLGPAGVETVKD